MAGENRNGLVALDFADGEHRFRLAIGQLEELQEKTGVGPFVLLRRLIDGEWRIADVRETLRIGLIGGGMEPLTALRLVRTYVDERSDWMAHSALARLVVLAALAGAPEEQPGKDHTPEAMTEASIYPTDASPSANGTEPPAQSGSPSPTSEA